MRKDVLRYIEANRNELEELVENNLYEREMTFDEYVKMMENNVTCGFEITLRIIGEMFNVSILVIRSDFLWISQRVEPVKCNIVLVQNMEGKFYGTQGKGKCEVGLVPKVLSPLSRKSGTSTPRKGTKKNPTNVSFESKLSPIVEKAEVPVNTSTSPPVFLPICKPIVGSQKVLTERHSNIPKGGKVQTKRLGVTGPSQKVTLPMVDISQSMGGSPSVTVRKIDDKDVIIRLQCTKCCRDFFTMQGYNNHLFMDHKIRRVEDYPPKTIKQMDSSMSTSYGSGKFDAVLNAEKEASKQDEGDGVVESESNLPIINPPKIRISKAKKTDKKFNKGKTIPCDKCKERFFTDDGLRIHVSHAHDDDWQEFIASKEPNQSNADYEDPSEENQRGRKRKRGNSDNGRRNTSVGKRQKKKDDEKSSENTEVQDKSVSGRRTRSRTKLLSQSTIEGEADRKKIKITDSSQDLSKDELVKTYNLRKKDKPEIVANRSENALIENEGNDATDDTGSKNTDGKDETVKNNENINDAEIFIDGLPAQNDNVQDSDRSGNLESGQDSAYRTEQESTEVTGSTVVDDTVEDPDFNADEQADNSTDLTVTTEEKSADQITGNIASEEIQGKSQDNKKRQKTDTKKRSNKAENTSANGNSSEDTEIEENNDQTEDKSKKSKDKKKKKTEVKSSNSTVQSENTGVKTHKNPDDDDDEEDQFYYYCDKCSNKFNDWKELQRHKLDCFKIAKKFVCKKCNRGFQQKAMMEQHFDFYHTNKPKRYVCNEHKKCYVFKKSYDEHLRRAHSNGKFRFVCDYCGKGFFHKGEFTIHRDSVHLNRRDYACNKCQQRAFTSVGRLNAHLEKCGKQATHECGICGKMYHSKENLYTHIQDVHQSDHTRKCPLCEEKVYTSDGGYYKHLRVKHNISRQTVKLSEYMKAQSGRKPENEEEHSESEEEAQTKPTRRSTRSRKSENTEDEADLLANNPKTKGAVPDKPENTDKNKGKKKDKVDPKPENTEKETSKKKGKGLKRKEEDRDEEKPKVPESYPAKRTRSNGPVTWDCPFCEDIKYTDNLKYLMHLQEKHKCGVPPESGQKDKQKGKNKKGTKGKGKK